MAQEMMMDMPGAGTAAAEAGRGTDMVMAHMTPGEIVIPIELQQDPDVMQMLQALFQQAGADLAQYTVGDPANSINPETGYPEFGWFKSIKKIFKKVAPFAPIALSLIPGLQGVGAALGGSLLGAGAAGSATLGNALIGGGLGALSGGGLKSALIGAGTGAIGANIGGVGAPGESGSGILGAIGRNVPGVQDLVSGVDSLGSSLLSSTGLSSPSNAISADRTALESAMGFSPSPANVTGLQSAAGGGGSSLMGLAGALASAGGGVQTDDAIKKAKEQQLLAQQQQLANLDTFDPSGITSDPGYEFNRAEGEKGLQRSLGASGNVFSGRALKAASQYNQDYANNAFKDYYSRWLTKTGAQNQLYGNVGDVKSNATMAKSNNLAQTLSNVFGTQVGGYGGNSALLDLLKRQGAY